MTIQDVVWYSEGQRLTNQTKMLEGWRMVRRLCFVMARTMGGFKGEETSLWQIEGDSSNEVSMDKIKAWQERLKELGK
jgi:hypothetical protein